MVAHILLDRFLQCVENYDLCFLCMCLNSPPFLFFRNACCDYVYVCYIPRSSSENEKASVAPSRLTRSMCIANIYCSRSNA